MALTRKFLSALGIDADKVDEIINAHTETVDALKNERDKYKADAEKLPEVTRELTSLKETVAKNGDKNPFEVKYNALKEEFETYKKDQTAKETKAKKADAYRAMLKEAGVSEKRIEAVLRVSDVDGVKLDKDGKIEGKDALIESVKKEWSDFITTGGTQGANTPNPPANGGGKTYKTKEEIYAIKDTAERQAEIAKNLQAFGH